MIKGLQLKSHNFILLLSFYFFSVLNFSLWKYVLDNAELTSFVSWLAIFILSLLVFAANYVLFSLLTIPYIGKFIIIVLLLLSSTAEYATQNLGVIINSDMMKNLFETTAREAKDLVTPHALTYISLAGILPSLLVILCKIEYQNLKSELKKRIICVLIAVSIPLALAPISYKEFVSFGRNHGKVRHYLNTFNYITSYLRYRKKTSVKKHEFVILDNSPVIEKGEGQAPRVLVYILGETARSDHFSLCGYEKETNPLTAKEDVVVYKDVISCGTSTTISVPCMFMASTKDTFKSNSEIYTENLLDIAKKAGYDVFWKDNDDGCKHVCDRVETQDARLNNNQPYCFGSYCYDEVMLEGLDERIANITKDTIIVLHTMGSHGPTYYKRYPDEFKVFSPSCDGADLQICSQEEISNTYDNTILYTDYIISSVINKLKQYPQLSSSVLYVSDHGESLGENNIYLHGVPYTIAPDEQKKVPMIFWFSDKIKEDLSLDIEELKLSAQNDIFSHDNLFPSLMHLLSVKTSAVNDELAKLNIFKKAKAQ